MEDVAKEIEQLQAEKSKLEARAATLEKWVAIVAGATGFLFLLVIMIRITA